MAGSKDRMIDGLLRADAGRGSTRKRMGFERRGDVRAGVARRWERTKTHGPILRLLGLGKGWRVCGVWVWVCGLWVWVWVWGLGSMGYVEEAACRGRRVKKGVELRWKKAEGKPLRGGRRSSTERAETVGWQGGRC